MRRSRVVRLTSAAAFVPLLASLRFSLLHVRLKNVHRLCSGLFFGFPAAPAGTTPSSWPVGAPFRTFFLLSRLKGAREGGPGRFAIGSPGVGAWRSSPCGLPGEGAGLLLRGAGPPRGRFFRGPCVAPSPRARPVPPGAPARPGDGLGRRLASQGRGRQGAVVGGGGLLPSSGVFAVSRLRAPSPGRGASQGAGASFCCRSPV